jgi:hypothetical protein
MSGSCLNAVDKSYLIFGVLRGDWLVIREERLVVLHKDSHFRGFLRVKELNNGITLGQIIILVRFLSLVNRWGRVSALISISNFNTNTLAVAGVLVGLFVNSANWLRRRRASTMAWQNRIAFTLIQDFYSLFAFDLARVLVGFSVGSAHRLVVLRAGGAAELGPVLIHAGSVVGLSDISALNQAFVVVGFLVNSANWKVEVFTPARSVGRAGSLGVQLSLGAVKVALVVISDSVFTAHKREIPGTVVALCEVAARALSLVENGLALAFQQAFVLEGDVLSAANRLVDSGATAWPLAGVLGGNEHSSANGNTLVLVRNVVSSANWVEAEVCAGDSWGRAHTRARD